MTDEEVGEVQILPQAHEEVQHLGGFFDGLQQGRLPVKTRVLCVGLVQHSGTGALRGRGPEPQSVGTQVTRPFAQSVFSVALKVWPLPFFIKEFP